MMQNYLISFHSRQMQSDKTILSRRTHLSSTHIHTEYMQSGWIESPPVYVCACAAASLLWCRWWIFLFLLSLEDIFLPLVDLKKKISFFSSSIPVKKKKRKKEKKKKLNTAQKKEKENLNSEMKFKITGGRLVHWV